MARIKNGLLSGLIGNMIASSWKGIPVLKGKKETISNPRTVAQVHNRMAFAAISSFCSMHKQIIKIGFQGYQKAFYPMNEARSVNAPKHTVTGIWPDITIHYNKIKVSNGSLPLPLDVSGAINDNRLTINWSGNERLQASGSTDFLMVVLHYPEAEPYLNQAVHHICAARRKDRTVTIPLENRQFNHFHAWVFFIKENLNADKDRANVSDSWYIGEF